jgi:glycosyltransferase involved in cell wall biosynthesis
MKLLFLSRWLPYPASNGSKLRIYNLLSQLARRGHQIHLLTYYEAGENPQAAAEHMGQFCAKVECVPYKPFRPDNWRSRAGFLALKPRSVLATFQPEMARRVETALVVGKAERLIASEIDMAEYGLLARKYGVPAFLEELEISVLYEQFSKARSPKARARFALTWLKYTNYIRYLARHYPAISVVSEQEQALLRPLAGTTSLHVLPNGASLQTYQFHPYQAAERTNRLVFNGALTFKLNFEAMRYFLNEVFPLVRKADPTMEVWITGKHDGVDLAALLKNGSDGIVFTGYLDDLRPVIAQSAECIAPLLQGGGTRLKILEAFALGTPVVATSKGAEGLQARSGTHLLIADTPQEFAAAILKLKKEPALAAHLAENARKLVETTYNWDDIVAHLESILQNLPK